MQYRKLLEIVAPCGLDCRKCLAFENGEIRMHSMAILDLLGPNFASYAERFSKMNSIFFHYTGFEKFIAFLGEGICGGCRKSGCLFQACGVHICVREKGVDFCFECDDFPCNQHGLHPPLYERWKKNNTTIKALGIQGYYEKIKNLPRYP